jgi:hydroxymethylbilane synthase
MLEPILPIPRNLTIATRQSRLALWQARHIQTLLQRQGHRIQLLGLTTEGDRILDRPLSETGGKGLFVKEIEHALQEGRADMAVHSLKDVPMTLPEDLMLACVLEREDPRDAWVSVHHASVHDAPPSCVVGTSSLRRVTQLHALRPDLQTAPLRGNVDTRLRKLDEGHLDAIVLAVAGLKRLGLQNRIRQYLEPATLLPAAAQGALAIEIRTDRTDLLPVLAPLVHQPTWLQVAAERAVSRALGGSCTVPLAALAQFSGKDMLFLQAAWGAPDGSLLRAQSQAVCISIAEAEQMGMAVAQQLIQQGAVVAG